MNFSKHYFVENDGGSSGAELKKFASDVVGGDVYKPSRKNDLPKTDKRFGKKSVGSDGKPLKKPEDKETPEPKDTEQAPEEKPEETPKPKANKELPVKMKFGGHGYMNDDGHTIFNSIASDIKGGKYGDNVLKVTKSNQEKMSGYKIVFKPQGENPDLPEYNRTMYVYKNKDKTAQPWTSVVFRGRESFRDGLKLFFPGVLKDRAKLNDVASHVKWHQAPPASISDPIAYASWKNTEIPKEDVDFTVSAIQDALGDKKEQAESFSEFYEYELLSENIVDDALMKTFKGIGGGIKTAILQPRPLILRNPAQLKKYFPDNVTYRVSQGSFEAVNTMCSESFAEYEKMKEQYGIIAQQFVKMRNVFVSNLSEVQIIRPKKPEDIDKWEQEFDKVIKDYALGDKPLRIDEIRSYETTNNGVISTMMFSVMEPQPEAEEGAEGGAEDLSQGDVENIFVVGANAGGAKFFKAQFGMELKQYLQRHKGRDKAKVKEDRAKMAETTAKTMDDMENQERKTNMKTSRSVFKRSEIPNEEFNQILQKFDAEVRDKGKLKSGPNKTEKDGMAVTSYILNNNGKVSFVNDGKGTDGRVIFTPAATPFMKTIDDVTKYNKEGN